MRNPSQFERNLEDVVETLPLPVRSAVSPLPREPVSCFVAISGFEQRCVSAAQDLVTRGLHSNTAICVSYAHANMPENMQHKNDLYDAVRQITQGREPRPLIYNDHDFASDFGEILFSALSEEGVDCDSPDTTIVLDITVGSSRLLLEGLHMLLGTNVCLYLAYSEAFEYRPSFSEYLKLCEEKYADPPVPDFLTLGIDRIELLKRIPGSGADARPAYLVVFPSFTPTRIGAVLEELSPNRVHWLFGLPHRMQNRWRLDAQREFHEHLVQRLHRSCYVSTFDYRETLDVLNKIYERRKNDYTILICSCGSKLQKVGQVLFHILRPEVGAVVSVPKKWDSERYSSEPPHRTYLLNMGNCASIRRELQLTKTLRL